MVTHKSASPSNGGPGGLDQIVQDTTGGRGARIRNHEKLGGKFRCKGGGTRLERRPTAPLCPSVDQPLPTEGMVGH